MVKAKTLKVEKPPEKAFVRVASTKVIVEIVKQVDHWYRNGLNGEERESVTISYEQAVKLRDQLSAALERVDANISKKAAKK